MKNIVSYVAFILLSVHSVSGATYTAAIGTNNWGAAAFGAVPTATDDIIVPGGAIVQVLNVINMCRNLTIQSGGTVRFAQANAWLRIKNGGTVTINSGGTLSRNAFGGLELVFEDNTDYIFQCDGVCNMSDMNGDGNRLSVACAGRTLTLQGSGNIVFETVTYTQANATVTLNTGTTMTLSQDINFGNRINSVFNNYGVLFCDEAGKNPGSGSAFHNRSGASANIGWGEFGTSADPFKTSVNFTLYADYSNNSVNYCGTLASQNIAVPDNGYYNLEISYIRPLGGALPAGIRKKVVLGNFRVINHLKLTRGKMDLNGFTISVANSATGGITYTSGYIQSERVDHSSRILWSIGTTTGSHIIPFITAANVVIPFTFNLTAGDAGDVIFSTYGTPPDNLPWPVSPEAVNNLNSSAGLIPDNRDATVDRFWLVQPGGATATATLTFNFAASEMPAAPYNTTVSAQRYNGSMDMWESAWPGQTVSGNSVTTPGVQRFMNLAITHSMSPLPVNLIFFEAEPYADGVKLSWEASNESPNSSYIVERSNDAIHYAVLDTVKGSGDEAVSYYHLMDNTPHTDIAYYRLLKTEDGTVYEPLGAVTVDFTSTSVPSVYPLPNDGEHIHLRLPLRRRSDYTMRILNIHGGLVHESILSERDGTDHDIRFYEKLASGIYIIHVFSKEEHYHYIMNVSR